MNAMELMWKATAILVAAFAVTAALRRGPAALRHFLWTAAFAALVTLPVASLVVPRWSLRTPAAAPVAAFRVAVAGQPPTAPSPTTPSPTTRRIPWLPVLWATGFLAASVRFAGGAIRTSLMVRRSTPCAPAGMDSRRVRTVESTETPMPMTWGVFRPVVILPAGAAAWPAARLRTVLLHEMAHVRRRDVLAQTIAQVACCAYWFHPLAWMALRQLRKERELACDDAVLRQGVAAHDYAAELMEIARRVSDWIDAPAMAESSDLEARVTAVLDRTRDRRPLSGLAALAVAAIATAVLAPLAVVTAHAQPAMGTIAGVVMDPSGARIPSCKVTARNLDGANEETAMADAAGEFRLSVPSGRYLVVVAAAGFAVDRKELTVVSGATARSDRWLTIGTISESVTLKGSRQRTAPPAAAPAGPAERLRIGGNVMQSRLINGPRPVYSDELKQLGVEGVVSIRAIISKQGSVANLKVINTADPRLVAAAVDAIKQWRYTPTLLNGEPVEVVTNIDVQFQLDK